MYIYALVCPNENIIRYVGKSVKPLKRFKKHIQCKCTNLRKNRWIQNLLDKGQQPILQILEETTEELVDEREIYFINKYKSDSLTNLTDGGEGGDTWSQHPDNEQLRKKQSERYKGEGNPMYGRKRSKRILVVDPGGIQFSVEGTKTVNTFLKTSLSKISHVLQGKKAHVNGYQLFYYGTEMNILDPKDLPKYNTVNQFS